MPRAGSRKWTSLWLQVFTHQSMLGVRVRALPLALFPAITLEALA